MRPRWPEPPKAMDDCFSDGVTTLAGGCRQLPGIVTRLVHSFLTAAAHRAGDPPSGVVDFCEPHPAPAVEHIPALRLWDLLFLGCRNIGAELLHRRAAGGRHWLTHAELLELGPRTLVGLPALVLLRMVLRGSCGWRHRQRQGLLLCSGQWLTRENLPEAFVGQEALSWMLEAQDALKAARVGHSDVPVLEGLALWEGDVDGVEALAPGQDVEVTEDVTTLSFTVPAGSPGVVEELSQDRQQARVRFAGSGRALPVEASKLQKLGGDRPKPLEALPTREAARKLAAMRAAVGRVRSTAVTLTSKPMYAKFFQSMVLTPLEHDLDPEPQQRPDVRRRSGRRATSAAGRRAVSAC